MPAPLRAGVAYFLVAFAFGFLFGAFRELAARRYVGEIAAILAEIPVMLAISWFAARELVRRFDVPRAAAARLLMGGAALALLLAAEAALAVLGLGQSLAQHLSSYASPRGAVTIASEAVFGLIPLLIARGGKPA